MAEVALACALLVGSALLVRTVGADDARTVRRRADERRADRRAAVGRIQQPTRGRRSRASTPRSSIASASSRASCRPAAPTICLSSMAGATRSARQSGVRRVLKTGRRRSTISVSDGYFETMGARVIEGRGFTASDTPDGEAVVIVNETLARRHFPGDSAVGRVIVYDAGAGRPARPQPDVDVNTGREPRRRRRGRVSSASSPTSRTCRSAPRSSPRFTRRRGSSRSAASRSRWPPAMSVPRCRRCARR